MTSLLDVGVGSRGDNLSPWHFLAYQARRVASQTTSKNGEVLIRSAQLVA